MPTAGMGTPPAPPERTIAAESMFMDLWGSLQVVLRRWYVVLPALAITLAVALVAGARTETTYTATGSTVFLAPNLAKTQNPYSNFNASLQTTAQVVGDDVNSSTTRREFQDKLLNSTYKVVVPYDPTRAVLLPEVTYTVEDADGKIAVQTVLALGQKVNEQLRKRQEASGAPVDSWIQAVPGPTTDRAEENTGSRVRTTAILLLLGVAISLSLAFVAEGIATARKRRRERQAGITPSPSNTSEATGLLREAVTAMRLAVDVVEDTAVAAAVETDRTPDTDAANGAQPGSTTNGKRRDTTKDSATDDLADAEPAARPRR